MIELDILRHGECEGGARFNGHTDVPLTAWGWQQMQAAMTESIPPWDGIVTSPLQRCSRFAAYLAEDYALPLRIETRLMELHFGDWEACSAEQLMAGPYRELLSRFWADPLNHPPPNGGSLTDFAMRIHQALDDLAQQCAGQRLLLVTHAGVIRAVPGQEQGLTWTQRLGLCVPHASRHHLHYSSPS